MTSWGRQYNEAITYWTPPTRDSADNLVFSTPTEIDVAYAEKNELYIDDVGEERVSKSIIRSNIALQALGFVYLGNLADLSPADILDPRDNTDVYPIRRVSKEKSLRTATFEYKAMV